MRHLFTLPNPIEVSRYAPLRSGSDPRPERVRFPQEARHLRADLRRHPAGPQLRDVPHRAHLDLRAPDAGGLRGAHRQPRDEDARRPEVRRRDASSRGSTPGMFGIAAALAAPRQRLPGAGRDRSKGSTPHPHRLRRLLGQLLPRGTSAPTSPRWTSSMRGDSTEAPDGRTHGDGGARGDGLLVRAQPHLARARRRDRGQPPLLQPARPRPRLHQLRARHPPDVRHLDYHAATSPSRPGGATPSRRSSPAGAASTTAAPAAAARTSSTTRWDATAPPSRTPSSSRRT